ncbi:MAG: hypothetical protein ACLQNE_26235 [Thermoguttaceae bacterium]|jgi:hypothetical protein
MVQRQVVVAKEVKRLLARLLTPKKKWRMGTLADAQERSCGAEWSGLQMKEAASTTIGHDEALAASCTEALM